MVSTAAQSERLYEEALREGQVRHALKTALGCCLATALSFFFHLPSGQLAPVFAYLLMTVGMPSPRLNWVLAQLAIVVSALVSALVLVAFGAAPLLYLALTLLWIFTCVLFTNRFSLPATLGAMVSALGIFVFFDGDVGGTLGFYVAYGLNFLIAGFSVAVVHTLLWQLNTRKVFLERVAAVLVRLRPERRLAILGREIQVDRHRLPEDVAVVFKHRDVSVGVELQVLGRLGLGHFDRDVLVLEP